MSLATQISVIGSLPSAGSVPGGGSATTDAGDLTTGTLAAARLPGVLANVDTQAELLSAAAAAAASHTHAASDIASGTVATARLGSGSADSTTFLRGDQTWATPSDATKLPLAGGTLSGDLLHSTSIRIGPNTSDGADNLYTQVGHSGNTRGGNLTVFGNEASSSAGCAHIALGNAANSVFRVYSGDGSTPLFYVTSSNGLTTITGGLDLGWCTLRITGSPTSAGASVRNLHGNGGTTDLYANVPDTGGFAVTENGSKMMEIREFIPTFPQLRIYNGGATGAAAILNSAGSNYYDIYGGSGNHIFRTGDTGYTLYHLSYNALGAGTRGIHCNGNVNDLKLNINSSGLGALAANGNDVIRWNTGGASILGAVYGPTSDWFMRPQSDSVSLTFHGGLNSGGRVTLHGASGNKAGVVATTPTPITRASNGTWTDVYNLGLGTHRGDFWIYDSLSEGHARLPVNGTSLGSIVDNAGGVTYVDAGSAGTGNVAFRISGGALQINVGTAVAASTQFAIEYRGGLY